ncbi:MAG: hypothetical protein QM674_23820, partial [Burkholderiaceae bacterium]
EAQPPTQAPARRAGEARARAKAVARADAMAQAEADAAAKAAGLMVPVLPKGKNKGSFRD